MANLWSRYHFHVVGRAAVELDFNFHNHPIPTEKSVGIPSQSLYPHPEIIEYLLRLGVKAGFSLLPGGR